jgi:hypothetical protein
MILKNHSPLPQAYCAEMTVQMDFASLSICLMILIPKIFIRKYIAPISYHASFKKCVACIHCAVLQTKISWIIPRLDLCCNSITVTLVRSAEGYWEIVLIKPVNGAIMMYPEECWESG